MKNYVILSALMLISLCCVLPQTAIAQLADPATVTDSKATVIYVVVKKVTFDGTTTFAVLSKPEVKTLKDTYLVEAKALSKAVQLVKKEWKTANPKVPFPRIAIGMSKVGELGTFTDEAKAKAALNKFTEEWKKLEERKAKVLENRLARMRPEQKAKYEADQKLQSEAYQKIRDKISTVLADMKAKELGKTKK